MESSCTALVEPERHFWQERPQASLGCTSNTYPLQNCLLAGSERLERISRECSRRLPAEHSLDILSSRSDPASKQFWSGYVFEVQPKLACGRSCQKCLSGSTRAVQEDSISHQPVAFIFFRIQMSLQYLADLLLCFFHAAQVGEPFRWYIANDFGRFRRRSLNRATDSDGSCSSPSFRSRQENPEERNYPSNRS